MEIKPIMYNVEKRSNIVLKSCGVSAARFLKHRKIFKVCLASFQHYNIMYKRFNGKHLRLNSTFGFISLTLQN